LIIESTDSTLGNFSRSSLISAKVCRLSFEIRSCFGSYVRDTNLPKFIDPKSDIDYLVVFNKSEADHPDQLLNYLQEFVANNFSQENIIQVSPTCVIMINNIRLELIPAYRNEKYFINYKIPNHEKGIIEWTETVPNDLNDFIKKVDSDHNDHILPTIRLLKYWNVLNHCIYSSYLLENIIVSMDFPQYDNLIDYLFFTVENLTLENVDEKNIAVVNKFKKSIKEIQEEKSEEIALYNLSTILPYI